MSYAERHLVAVTTTTGGAAEEYTPPVTGRVVCIRFTDTSFASTADLTITSEESLQNIWTESNVVASKTVYPLAYGNTVSGGQLTASGAILASGSAAFVPIVLANERIKIVVAQGGNEASAVFEAVVQ